MASLKLIRLRLTVVSNEVDCACSAFLADLTTLREKHASKCEELEGLIRRTREGGVNGSR
jgi:hypothetical protein